LKRSNKIIKTYPYAGKVGGVDEMDPADEPALLLELDIWKKKTIWP